MPDYLFPLVEQYMSIRLDIDLAALSPGPITIVESARRLQREESYGFVHSLWWVWLTDGRSAVSVPPGTATAVEKALAGIANMDALMNPSLAEALSFAIRPGLFHAGVAAPNRARHNLLFACSASHLRVHHRGDCRRLRDAITPPAEGLHLPEHCFPDGLVYGVMADDTVAAVAYAHRTGIMENLVADIGVETAPGYRRRGYAQAAVSAVAAEITARGGETYYGCSPENQASAATARSVGFVPYGYSLALSSPVSE